MVADLFNSHTHFQTEPIEKEKSGDKMHTSTHPSHHPYHMWLACVRDMAFYVRLDLCSHHFLPLVLIPVLVMLYCLLLYQYVCVCVRKYVRLFGNSFSRCFHMSFVIFSHILTSLSFFYRCVLSTPKHSRFLSSFCITVARLILHILWKIGFNMIYLRFANMYYDCNIQLT